MTKNLIIDIIIKHEPYKRYCNRLCNYQDIANDLYQEFFIIMWNKSEEDLISIHKSGGLEPYCLCVIWNKSRDKDRQTSGVLSNLSNNCLELTTQAIEDNFYNHKIDEDFEKIMDFLETNPYVKQDHVFVLLESIDTPVPKISKSTGVSINTLKRNQKNLKDRIKHYVRI